MPEKNSPCPCGSTLNYEKCCRVFLQNNTKPETAEQLMRSRYTAYTLHEVAYLKHTQHPSVEDVEIDPSIRFQSLQILSTSQGNEGDKQGKVSFVAIGLANGKLVEHREHSRFRRFKGDWVYFDHLG